VIQVSAQALHADVLRCTAAARRLGVLGNLRVGGLVWAVWPSSRGFFAGYRLTRGTYIRNSDFAKLVKKQ
jgi:hypothetical protein